MIVEHAVKGLDNLLEKRVLRCHGCVADMDRLLCSNLEG